MLRRIHRRVVLLERAFIAAAMGASILVAMAQVIYRYALQAPLPWSGEFLTYLFVWVTFVGAGGAGRRQLHVSMDVAVRRLPLSWQRVLQGVAKAGFACFLIALALLAAQQVWLEFRTHQLSPAMEIPIWIVTFSMVIGSAVTLLSVLLPREWEPGGWDATTEESPS